MLLNGIEFPENIFSGYFQTGHCQGIAVDAKNRWIYYSFTTQLVKTDFAGNLLGSVTGLLGHLGCIVFNPNDGRVYGSLEYKDDAIGHGILNHLGTDATVENGFYIAVFDGAAITRADMDAEKDGIMRAAFLKRVTDDYLGSAPDGTLHIHGCSGIDGTAIGPVPGWEDKTPYLFVAYGVYRDNSRTDNDCQVLLRYDIAELNAYARPLSQGKMHRSGAEMREHAYFLYTGNTTYGVQNLEYDPYTDTYVLCVYTGQKPEFPNNPLYLLDASKPAELRELPGCDGERGELFSLLPSGIPHESGVFSWKYPEGSTGFASLGDGYYYISYDGHKDAGWYTDVRLCRWNGTDPLVPVNG